MAELGIIIPTLGRDTLRRTLASITPQLTERDAVHLVCDGGEAFLRAGVVLRETYDIFYPWVHSTEPELQGCPGASQRNWAMENIPVGLQSSHFLFIGDDDVYAPGALNVVRSWCDHYPDRCLMFQMYTFWHTLIWEGTELKEGNVSDHMFVVPNIPDKLGRYTNRYAGDFDFIRETVENFGGPENIIWVPEVIVHCRPGD